MLQVFHIRNVWWKNSNSKTILIPNNQQGDAAKGEDSKPDFLGAFASLWIALDVAKYQILLKIPLKKSRFRSPETKNS